MGRVLFVGLEERLQQLLVADASWLAGRTVERARAAGEAIEFLQGGDLVDLVIIGPAAPDPVRTLQRIGSLAVDASAAILHEPDEADRIRNALAFAPFIPDEVFCRSLNDPPSTQELTDWAERAPKRRRQEQQLLAANRQIAASSRPPSLSSGVYLDRLLDRAPIGICALDESLRIASWNHAAQQIFGRHEREVLGAPFPELVATSSSHDIEDILRQGTDSPLIVEAAIPGSEDHRLLELIAAPAGTADSTSGVLVLLTDVSERLRGERERERLLELQADLLARESEARAAAEAALRWRDDFLSVAAHELRTPLTSIKGFGQLLSRWLAHEPPQLDRARERIADLTAQVERYERLVDDLLDISRIQQGRLTIDPAPVDLADLTERVVRRFGYAEARTDRHQLRFHAAGPVDGMWDGGRLEQVVVNLISNAVRFSPGGGAITVTVRVSGDRAFIEVSDEGLGIPEDELGVIFEPFARATTGAEIVGTGLGLYISAQIVELHGGNIRVASRPGAGSSFTVELPRHRAGELPDGPSARQV